jgi:hypothetical protein
MRAAMSVTPATNNVNLLRMPLQIIAATAKWRLRPIANSHQMTATFFDFWTLQRAKGSVTKSRIYLPIDWWDLPEDQNLRRTLFLPAADSCISCPASLSVNTQREPLLGCSDTNEVVLLSSSGSSASTTARQTLSKRCVTSFMPSIAPSCTSLFSPSTAACTACECLLLNEKLQYFDTGRMATTCCSADTRGPEMLFTFELQGL